MKRVSTKHQSYVHISEAYEVQNMDGSLTRTGEP
jgi:hypothetical protein